MYIECESFEDVNKRAEEASESGGFASPGYICGRYGISRQVVHNWIRRDVIDAYRYKGKEGYFIFIPISEIENVYDSRIKKILANKNKKLDK